ncbi:UNVERIFIED_CONTAM: hypothetical protein GTU68_060792 [Idotea baltica]|nr:hypothetical protein [Idotea baltica]
MVFISESKMQTHSQLRMRS